MSGFSHSTDNDDQGQSGADVIMMDRFRSGRSLSPIRQAEAYWAALRDEAEVPKRSQIDPRGLENILEFSFILERIAPGIARFRLAGQHLTRLAGMEVRGMPLTAFFTAAARTHISAALENVFSEPAVAEVTLTGEGPSGHTGIEARMILLPLKNELGEVNRAAVDGPERIGFRQPVTDAGSRLLKGLGEFLNLLGTFRLAFFRNRRRAVV